MSRVAARFDHCHTHTGGFHPFERELGHSCADVLALVVGVDRQHVDLTDPCVVVEIDRNETHDPGVDFGDLDAHRQRGTDGLDGPLLRRTRIRLKRAVDVRPQHLPY